MYCDFPVEKWKAAIENYASASHESVYHKALLLLFISERQVWWLSAGSLMEPKEQDCETLCTVARFSLASPRSVLGR